MNELKFDLYAKYLSRFVNPMFCDSNSHAFTDATVYKKYWLQLNMLQLLRLKTKRRRSEFLL